jgi:hypothetical protein
MSDKTGTFDPAKFLRNIKGKGGTAEYLDVKWRLVWLRSEHPDATTSIEHIEIGPDQAIFRATVSIPGGGSATDYGSETPRDFGDYIEKAATKALGRALAQLGYGTQFVGDELDEGDRIVDSPRDRKPSPPARASTYSDTTIEARIIAAYQMFEAGERHRDIAKHLQDDWDNLTDAQTVEVDKALAEIERKIDEQRKASAPRQRAG